MIHKPSWTVGRLVMMWKEYDKLSWFKNFRQKLAAWVEIMNFQSEHWYCCSLNDERWYHPTKFDKYKEKYENERSR